MEGADSLFYLDCDLSARRFHLLDYTDSSACGVWKFAGGDFPRNSVSFG